MSTFQKKKKKKKSWKSCRQSIWLDHDNKFLQLQFDADEKNLTACSLAKMSLAWVLNGSIAAFLLSTFLGGSSGLKMKRIVHAPVRKRKNRRLPPNTCFWTCRKRFKLCFTNTNMLRRKNGYCSITFSQIRNCKNNKLLLCKFWVFRGRLSCSFGLHSDLFCRDWRWWRGRLVIRILFCRRRWIIRILFCRCWWKVRILFRRCRLVIRSELVSGLWIGFLFRLWLLFFLLSKLSYRYKNPINLAIQTILWLINSSCFLKLRKFAWRQNTRKRWLTFLVQDKIISKFSSIRLM